MTWANLFEIFNPLDCTRYLLIVSLLEKLCLFLKEGRFMSEKTVVSHGHDVGGKGTVGSALLLV